MIMRYTPQIHLKTAFSCHFGAPAYYLSMQWKLNKERQEDKMKTNTAYALQFEEILFTGRNRNYGAFVLRKNYTRNLMIACIAAVIIITGIVSTQKHEPMNIEITKKPSGGITIDLPTAPVNEKPVIPESPKVVPVQNTVKFRPPVVVEDSKALSDALPTVADLKEATPWTETMKGQEGGTDITYIEPVLPAVTPKEKEKDVEQPVMFAEEMPAYVEGTDALLKFFAAKIKYPELARKAGIEGKVYISFIVNRDGHVSNPEIIKGIGAGCDEEALRVVSLLGKWIPGKQNGKAVRVKMSIPIVFKLQ
jgi:protein TonB